MVRFNILLILFFILTSCDDKVWDNPLDPQNRPGEDEWFIWSINTQDGKGQLPENSPSGFKIGSFYQSVNSINYQYFYSIKSQKVDGTNVNHFTMNLDSESNFVLETNNNILNFEALSGSKEIIITINVTDGGEEQQTSDFDITIGISNVNESPTWGNTSIGTTADEGILFQSPEITWSDVDQGASHILSSDGLPGWMTIDVNKLTGTPSTADVNPSTSFTLKLQDQGGLEITKSFTINVRGNEAPSFTGSSAQTWEEERSLLWTISWSDPNSVDYSTMEASVSDVVSDLTFTPNSSGTYGTVSGYLPTSYVNQDINFSVTLNDNRAGNPLTATESFTITVDPNDAPVFTNTDNIIQSIHHGCQYSYDVNWNDPDGDGVSFVWDESIAWLNVNSYGQFSGTPAESDIGSSETVLLNITDDRPNVHLSTDYSFTISVDQNYAPEFTNAGSVDTTAPVGQEYSYQFGCDDANDDDFVFTVPNRPSWLGYNSSNYTISGTPNSNHVGTNNVTVKVEDCGTSTSFDFSIDVN